MSSIQCRLCMNATPKSLLNLKNEKTGEMLKKMNSCLNYQISLEKDLPCHICKDCYTKMIDYYNFQMSCLNAEANRRSAAGLPPPAMTREDPLSPNCKSSMSNQGVRLLRQNMATLNDKIASFYQERELFKSKIEAMQKENDQLKTTVISHSKTLPDVARGMMSLLSRMEQQFILSNSKIVNGSAEEREESQEGQEQMDTSYEQFLQWHQPHSEQSTSHQTPQVSFITTASSSRQAGETVTIPTVAYVCDTMVDHVAEVEIDCDPHPVSPSSPGRTTESPATYEEERVPMDSEVNALLIQLCEQQEKREAYQANPTPVVKSPVKASPTLRKTNEYELLVSRRSRRAIKKPAS